MLCIKKSIFSASVAVEVGTTGGGGAAKGLLVELALGPLDVAVEVAAVDTAVVTTVPVEPPAAVVTADTVVVGITTVVV